MSGDRKTSNLYYPAGDLMWYLSPIITRYDYSLAGNCQSKNTESYFYFSENGKGKKARKYKVSK